MTPTLNDVAAFTARLRDLSGRLARFEPVDPAELAEFETMRDRLLVSAHPVSGAANDG